MRPLSLLHGTRRRVVLAVAVVAVCLLGFGAFQGTKAARAAFAGKAALQRAEAQINEGKLDEAAASLTSARSDFAESRDEVRRLERFLPFSRWIPLVGTQVRGVAALADSGVLLSDAGMRLTDAASSIIDPEQEQLELSDALAQLREVQGLLRSGVNSIDEAAAKVDSLDGKLLIRPLGRARSDLAGRLPDIRRRAIETADGLSSLITFAGGDGPRSYLVLSQNPDELRPTGGYIGTYGVLSAVGGKLSLDRYDAIENWFRVHPEAVATPQERRGPLRLDSRAAGTLANVNADPDWTRGGRAGVPALGAGGRGSGPGRGLVHAGVSGPDPVCRGPGAGRGLRRDDLGREPGGAPRLLHPPPAAGAGRGPQGDHLRAGQGAHAQAVRGPGLEVGGLGQGAGPGFRQPGGDGVVR